MMFTGRLLNSHTGETEKIYLQGKLQETPGDTPKRRLSAADHTWYSRMWHKNQLCGITFMSALRKCTLKYYPPHWNDLTFTTMKAYTACSFGFWSYKAQYSYEYIQKYQLFCMSAKHDLLISGKRIRIVHVLQVGIQDGGSLRRIL
jgi:hypothetical protein